MTKPANELTLDDLEKMNSWDAVEGALRKAAAVVYEDIGQETEAVYRKRSAVMAQWVGYALGRIHRGDNHSCTNDAI